MHQIKGLKHEQRTREAKVGKLNAEILDLREALASKEKELADKDFLLANFDSLKEQLANS